MDAVSEHPFDRARRLHSEEFGLKPCPFDGGAAEVFTSDGWHGIRCTACTAQVQMHSSEERAVFCWNRRIETARVAGEGEG